MEKEQPESELTSSVCNGVHVKLHQDPKDAKEQEYLRELEPAVEKTGADQEAASDSNVVVEVPSKPYYFGFRCWHPKWMQVAFANAKFFTLILCLNGLVEGALIHGFATLVLSTVERRFKFTSTAVSVMLVSIDVSTLICIIFISYFGERRHKPRWIGYGLIMQGVGAFVFAAPQFIFGEYMVGSTEFESMSLESCDVNNESSTSPPDSFNDWAYAILLFGNILIGIGTAPLYTLGLSYIDDITLPKYVPIHTGVFYITGALGPAIGYSLGGAFLSIYVDPWEPTSLKLTDPVWVGAWWLCFVFSGILSFLVSIPFLLYPRFLSNYPQVVKARQKQHATSYTSRFTEEDSFKNQVKAFPIHMWHLCKNKSFVFVTFALSFLFLALYGLVAFGPKLIESVFSVTASAASVITGGVAIPAGILGTIVGSLMTYFLKSNTKRVAIIPFITSILIIPPLFGFFITCPTLPIAGITADYTNNSSFPDDFSTDVTISACNYDCMCNSTIYEPVCGQDGVTYFSPCRSGCDKTFMDNDTTEPVFSNCSCVSDNLLSRGHSSGYSDLLSNSTATSGNCPLNCKTLGIWLLLVGLVVFLIFLLRVPSLLITIRSVAEEQRSLALGVQSVLWRIMGSIPGPILFGVIFDSSCVYWQFERNRRGNCWVYNNHLISIRAFFLTVTGVSINLVFMFLCWLFYPPVSCVREGIDLNKEVTTTAGELNGTGNLVFDFAEQDGTFQDAKMACEESGVD